MVGKDGLDEDGNPPVKKGYVRLYKDHTGRWYEDVTESEMKKRQEAFDNDPIAQILIEEIQKEIDAEILKALTSSDFQV